MIASSFLRTSTSTRLLLLASRRPLSTSTLPLLSPPRPARRRRTAQEFLAVPRRAPSSHPPPPPPPPGPTGSPILEQAKQVTVDVPEDSRGVLKGTHGSRGLLEQSALVITRKIEMMNIFLGFEQGNRYQICNPEGEPVGFIAEEAQGILGTVSRQLLRTHRPFRAVIMDVEGNPILWVRRPFQFINSRIFVEAREGKDAPLVGEAQQDWHLWRRKYNLFLSRPSTDPTTGALVPAFDQFASIDERFWSWEFWLRDAEGRARGSVSRNFGGFGREIFTDTGTYILRFDAVNAEISDAQAHGPVVDPKTGVEVIVPPPSQGEGLTLDERAVALATAISIDFDYFSRQFVP
ncbi:Scramblase-domain-containing protein [Mrakia frigida]|uniref:Aim25p n=1 Tax=Mrakia frigida TaxID=29902 RepID=UPI003FCBF0A0